MLATEVCRISCCRRVLSRGVMICWCSITCGDRHRVFPLFVFRGKRIRQTKFRFLLLSGRCLLVFGHSCSACVHWGYGRCVLLRLLVSRPGAITSRRLTASTSFLKFCPWPLGLGHVFDRVTGGTMLAVIMEVDVERKQRQAGEGMLPRMTSWLGQPP